MCGRIFAARSAGPCVPGPVTVAHARQRGVGPPAIRENESARRDIVLYQSGQRARRGVRHHLEANSAGGRPAHFHRADDQGLIQELAAALETHIGTAHVGFVDLDLVLQRFPVRSHHGPAELVQERPGRLVTDPELTLQLDRRQPGRMGRHEAGRPEPYRQRQPRTMQNRPRSQGGLPATRFALPQPPSRQLEDFCLPTSRTANSLWPPAGGQVLPTHVVVPEPSLELLQRPGKVRAPHLATLAIVPASRVRSILLHMANIEPSFMARPMSPLSLSLPDMKSIWPDCLPLVMSSQSWAAI